MATHEGSIYPHGKIQNKCLEDWTNKDITDIIDRSTTEASQSEFQSSNSVLNRSEKETSCRLRPIHGIFHLASKYYIYFSNVWTGS